MTLSSAYIELFIRGEMSGGNVRRGEMSGYHINIPTYIHTYIHTHMHTYMLNMHMHISIFMYIGYWFTYSGTMDASI